MHPRSIALALVAGIATLAAVGIAVTALLEPTVEFSVFVGFPAGVVAGALAAAVVSLRVGDDSPADRRRVALAFGAFGVGFLVTLLGLAVAGQGVVLSTVVGLLVGLLAAVVGYRRGPKAPPAVAS
jgi:hypothetical protein